MRLIDADALKNAISNNSLIDFTDDDIFEIVDNAPTVSYPFYTEAYQTGFEEAKLKIIHSITEQYKAHNKLVPIWLTIGDIK